MNLERLKQISQDNNLAQMSEWIEINSELAKELNTNKEFGKYARWNADKVKKDNMAMLDIFQMLKLFISFSDKDEEYNKYLEAIKPKPKTETNIDKVKEALDKQDKINTIKEDVNKKEEPEDEDHEFEGNEENENFNASEATSTIDKSQFNENTPEELKSPNIVGEVKPKRKRRTKAEMLALKQVETQINSSEEHVKEENNVLDVAEMLEEATKELEVPKQSQEDIEKELNKAFSNEVKWIRLANTEEEKKALKWDVIATLPLQRFVMVRITSPIAELEETIEVYSFATYEEYKNFQDKIKQDESMKNEFIYIDLSKTPEYKKKTDNFNKDYLVQIKDGIAKIATKTYAYKETNARS